MGLTINVTYDSSVGSAPAGFKTAVTAAVDFLEHAFSNPVTINIALGYGEVNGSPLGAGDLGESEFNANYYTYSQVKSALAANATSQDDLTAVGALPSSDPTNGGKYFVTNGEQKLLGLKPGNALGLDGSIGLSSAVQFSYDPNNRAVAGDYDAVGTLEHEMTEIMGRVGSLGSSFGSNVYTPLDLFRYSSPGVRDLTPGPGNFSVDGQTMLTAYNDPTNGGDAADWDPSLPGDSFGDGYTGTVGAVSPTDLREMNVIGANRAPATALDFNGDAVSDILAQGGSTLYAWAMQGSQYAGGTTIGTLGSGWSVAGSGDFNGDGTVDLLVQNGGSISDWMIQNGTFSSSTVITTSLSAGWNVVGTGDFTGNGTSDVLLKNGGTIVDWIMNNGQYQSGNTLTTSLSAGWNVVGTGDFNGDGTTDVLLQNGGTIVDWLMRNGVYQSGNTITTALSGWNVVGTGDFNGDGTTDILLADGHGDFADWTMKNGQYQSGHTIATGAVGWSVVGTGDYNGDGTTDILLKNGGTIVDWVMQNGAYLTANVVTNNATPYTVT